MSRSSLRRAEVSRSSLSAAQRRSSAIVCAPGVQMQRREEHLSSPHLFVMQGFFLFPDVKESVFISLISVSSLTPGLRIRIRNFSSFLPSQGRFFQGKKFRINSSLKRILVSEISLI